MPRRGQRTVVKICPCGCGQQIEPYLNKQTGRVAHYPKFVAGHGAKDWGRRLRGIPKPDRQLPVGTTRLHDTGAGIYRIVKTESGKWKYEHRLIVAAILGRELQSWEHVHHANQDKLDNSPDNLVLTTRHGHPAIHHVHIAWAKAHRCCINCGTTQRRHCSLGLCTACYQRIRAAERGWPSKKARLVVNSPPEN